MQRVVERAQVGVDLLVERAGQEAQPLPRLDGGPGEDDPVDLLLLQRPDRLGHGQVGLAGAGGADAEDDGVLVDRVDIALLVGRLGADRPAARGEDVEGEHLHRPVGGELEHRDAPLDGVGRQLGATAHRLDQLLEEADDGAALVGGAGDGDLVAADVDVGLPEGALDDAERLIT